MPCNNCDQERKRRLQRQSLNSTESAAARRLQEKRLAEKRKMPPAPAASPKISTSNQISHQIRVGGNVKKF